MTWETWFTLIVIVVTVGMMAREVVPPALAILGGVIVLLLAGIIDGDQALSGFSNSTVWLIFAAFVIAVLIKTFLVQAFFIPSESNSAAADQCLRPSASSAHETIVCGSPTSFCAG